MTGFSSGSHGSPPPLKSSARASGSFGSGGVGALASLIVGSRIVRGVPVTARVIEVELCRAKIPDAISGNPASANPLTKIPFRPNGAVSSWVLETPLRRAPE